MTSTRTHDDNGRRIIALPARPKKGAKPRLGAGFDRTR